MKANRQSLLLRMTVAFKVVTLLLCALILVKVGVALFREQVIDLGILLTILIASAALYLVSWTAWRAAGASVSGKRRR